MQLYRADLHVHSRYSGAAKHLRFLRCRDCYSQPIDVYHTAKRRGMDLVTISDHNSIDGCLELLNRLGELPDFIIGEEVSTYFPQFRHEVHVGVYGLNEAQHREIQTLRPNGEELLGYLRGKKNLFVLNHFFHNFANFARLHAFVERMLELFDVVEIRNGTQQTAHNTFVERLLERRQNGFRSGRRLGVVGGSDSHSLRRIGRTYTASPARNREEFLADIRAGRTRVCGAHADHLSLAADIYGVVLRYYPAVLSLRNGEFSPPLRLRSFFLSLLAGPFLATPYVVALRHSLIQQRRIARYQRAVLGGEDSSAVLPSNPEEAGA